MRLNGTTRSGRRSKRSQRHSSNSAEWKRRRADGGLVPEGNAQRRRPRRHEGPYRRFCGQSPGKTRGATAVNLPKEKILDALANGPLDAFEWIVPYDHEKFAASGDDEYLSWQVAEYSFDNFMIRERRQARTVIAKEAVLWTAPLFATLPPRLGFERRRQHESIRRAPSHSMFRHSNRSILTAATQCYFYDLSRLRRLTRADQND